MRSLTKAHSRKRPALVTTTTSNLRGGRLRELRLYFLFLCTFFICLVPGFFCSLVEQFFSLWVFSLYSHCWLFLGSRGFCDNVFVVVVVTYKCREDHRSQNLPGLPGIEPWPLRYRCTALTNWDGKTTGSWSLNWFMNFIYWNCGIKK